MACRIKQIADWLGATLWLLLALPFLALIALFVIAIDGRPVFFRHPRAGQGGASFTLYKFRTMTEACGPDGQWLPDGERLTRLGRWLRRLSLDELPQLWNVWRGEMSFVGPRPLPLRYLPRYTPQQNRRHEVKPGITGWAQINGRNAISWEEKFRLDVWYVDHWSLALDVKILALTVWKVLSGQGLSQEGQATMEEFRGSPPA